MSVEIYTKPNCPWCVKAKDFLRQKNIPYAEHVLGTNAKKEDIQAKIHSLGLTTEVKTVPQIFYTNKNNQTIHIGGYTDLISKQNILGT